MKNLTITFLQKREEYDSNQLVFVDECGINIHMGRKVGYSPVNQRLYASKPGCYTQNYTILGSMSMQGIGALMSIKGGTSTQVFMEYARQVLLPELKVGQIVILDNLAAHKNKEVVKLFEEHGVELLYTPPYSPEWNPIEWAWSKIKTYLRQFAARDLESLEDALVQAADLLLPSHAYNMISACGYNMVTSSL